MMATVAPLAAVSVVHFVVPGYQTQNGVNTVAINENPCGFKGRGLPDLAAHADPSTGYNVLVDGQAMVIGGTSAVAPLVSALLARIDQSLNGRTAGFIHPVLYKSGPSNDIVEGNNETGAGWFGFVNVGYTACPGWDA